MEDMEKNFMSDIIKEMKVKLEKDLFGQSLDLA